MSAIVLGTVDIRGISTTSRYLASFHLLLTEAPELMSTHGLVSRNTADTLHVD